MKQQRIISYKLKVVRGNYNCLPEWINEKGDITGNDKNDLLATLID